jgi:metallo-beta-lactamase family protein
MTEPVLTFHGAARTVTGSCFEIALGGRRVLVDCGLFQGPRSLEALNRERFAFDPRKIDAVLLTHAHMDHCGLLPRLAAEGFSGSIWCTAGTADLLPVMLPDAARIQEQDAARRNRRADRADEPPIEPLYTLADAETAIALARPAALEVEFEPAPGFRARFWNAGHILGAASVELFAGKTRLLFSGDLGPGHKAFQLDPAGPRGLDHLFCESTYGDRDRPPVTIEQRRALLEQEVNDALGRRGNLVIPVFALERTQELLLDLAQLIEQGRIRNTQVFIDSPLASRATRVFRAHQNELQDLDGGDVFRHPSFHFVESVEESIRLNSLSGAIILAASGMCEAGRIRHHLLHNLPNAGSTILFVGFQAQGTLGRTILEGARRVRISGRDVAVRAQIRRIDSYSAHADRTELLAWIEARQPVLGSLFLTHGETRAIDRLRKDAGAFVPSVIAPEIGERYALPANAPARRLATGRADLQALVSRDWQNDYADLAVNLKRDLQRIEGAARRAEAIARIRDVLDRYGASREGRRAASGMRAKAS